MGGGSSGYSVRPSKSESEAERVFDSATEEARRSRLRNVFISFHIDDEMQVELLRAQAKNEKYDIEFRDYSVKAPFDEKWKTNCRERIAQTSMLICMIGPETANREAVNWEIDEAYRQNKQVVGVRIYRDRNDPIPESMQRNKAQIVNWDLKVISRLIDKR
jgi:hypothetical protein